MRNALAFIGAVLAAASLAAQTAPAIPEIDVTESVLLLRNLLKDMPKEKTLPAQYRMFMRARELHQQLASHLSPAKHQSFRRPLQQAFAQLPLPPAVTTRVGLGLAKVTRREETWYWSDAVSRAQFVRFLNDAKVSRAVLDTWFAAPPFGYNRSFQRYTTENGELPLTGFSFAAAQAFTDWLGEQEGVPFSLPHGGQGPVDVRATVHAWTADQWQDPDFKRQQAQDIFGGGFRVLQLGQQRVGEFPEAMVPGVKCFVVASPLAAKQLFLQALKGQ